MAYFDTTRPAAAGRLSRAVFHILAEIRAWKDGRATRKALARLSDHELCDIGLSRGDLDAAEDWQNGI